MSSRAETSTDRPVDGRYTVLRHLADGGMGSVFVARDERLSREVALKVMRPDLVSDPEFVERFRQEAQSAARLSDPHVVAVYDQGRDGDIVFLAMEYVRGTTLRHRLDQVGALTPREALDIMDAVLSALAAAHHIGTVHRDVKPENVLIRADGAVKVGDFGLARAVTSRTSTAMGRGVFGTFAYVSPEQVSRGVVDKRSDVYSAALMLYEMLTGEQAFAGDDPIHAAFRHVNEEPPAPSSIDETLPPELDEGVLAAATIDPDERPEDAERYRALLRGIRSQLTDEQLDVVPQAAVTHTPVTAKTDSRTERLDSVALANRTRLLQVLPAAEESPQPAGSTGESTHASAASSAAADPEPDTQKKSRRGPLAAVLGLVAALLVAAVAWVFVAGPGMLRDLPAVAGEPEQVALAALEEAGFSTQVEQAYSETVDKGDVISTDPAGPEQARALRPVTVVVSMGPERYEVPELSGQSADQAKEALDRSKLTFAGTEEQWHEQVPVGAVISTDPAAGTPLPPGGQVKVFVSKGREPIEVADWTGKSFTDAKVALEDKGLTVEVTDEPFNDDVAKGLVVSQEPADTTLHRGDTVKFVVSQGPQLVAVPEIQGKQEAEAIRILEDVGLSVTVSRIVGGVFGTARSTDPEAGTQVPKGSTITLYVV